MAIGMGMLFVLPSPMDHEFKETATSLQTASIRLDAWDFDQPSLVTHLALLCSTPRTECDRIRKDLVSYLTEGGLSRGALKRLHRAEIIESFRLLGMGGSELVRFADLELSSVGALLEESYQEGGGLHEVGYSRPREEVVGREWGWLLKGTCWYRGPDAGIGKGRTVHDVLASLIRQDAASTIRMATLEAGMHELEGLAECCPVESPSCAAVRRFLKDRAMEDASTLLENPDRSEILKSFTRKCGKSEDRICFTLGKANALAHLLTWAHGILGKDGLSGAILLFRLRLDLLEAMRAIDDYFAGDESGGWVSKSPENHAAFATAIAHSVDYVFRISRAH